MNKPRQMTKDEAIAFFNGDEWKDMSDYGIVALQLCQDKLCVPFSRFHEAIEKVLGRPVWTHEFAFSDSLVAEFEGRTDKATFADVLNKIPKDKQIFVVQP